MVAQFRPPTKPIFDNALPPQNIEIEEAILGGILLDSEAYPRLQKLSKPLEPEAFYLQGHQIIYRAIEDLAKKGYPTDLMTVTTYLSDKGKLDKIGGQSKLAQLVDQTVTALNIDRYAELLIEKHIRRKLIGIGHDLVDLAFDTYSPIEYVCKRIQSLVQSATEPIVANKNPEEYAYGCIISKIKEIIHKVHHSGLRMFKLSKLAKETGYTVRGLQSLFFADMAAEQNEPLLTFKQLLDKYGKDVQKWVVQGLLPRGSLTEIFALPGDGKTILTYDIIGSAVIGQPWNGFPVANKKIKAVIIQTDEAQQATIETLRDRFEGKNLECYFKTYWSIDQLFQLREELKDIQPDILMIDSLTSINRGTSKSENDADYAMDIYALRQMCGEMGIAGILIHHSNKMGDSRGSTGIPGAVDQVINLRRLLNVNDVSDPRRQLEIKKSRFRMPMTYALELNDDKTWTVTGKVGASLKLDGPAPEKIVAFLSANRGTVYSNRELSEFVGASYETVRTATLNLQKERLIEQCRGQGKAKLYYIPDDNSPNGYLLKAKRSPQTQMGETQTERSHKMITSEPAPQAESERNTEKQVENNQDFSKKATEKTDQICVSPETPTQPQSETDPQCDRNAIADEKIVFLPKCDRIEEIKEQYPCFSWVKVTVPAPHSRKGTYRGEVVQHTQEGLLILTLDNKSSVAAEPEWCEPIEVTRDRAGEIVGAGDTIFYAGDDPTFKKATDRCQLPLAVKRVRGDRVSVAHKNWGSMQFERLGTEFVKGRNS